MKRRARAIRVWSWMWLSAVSAGLILLPACQDRCPDRLVECRKSETALTEETVKLKKELASARQTIIAQRGQIANLQGFTEGQRRNLVSLNKIVLDRLTGGRDDDHDGYDDAILVYLRPVDVDGHTIKAAGKVSVTLFDLNGPKPVGLGEVHIPPGPLRKLWRGRFLANHYTIRCPFADRPVHGTVTVRVTFADVLTGQEFTAQKTCKIKIRPPGR